MGSVLVTGAAGFVGRAVVRALLAAGHEVRAGVRRPGVVVEGAGTVRCDVTDPTQVARAVDEADGVVHCAALTRVREAATRPAEYERVNVGGTRTLLDAAASRPGPPAAVVLLSTAAVYGTPAGRPVREDDPAAPGGPYAASSPPTRRPPPSPPPARSARCRCVPRTSPDPATATPRG